jgi:hypothetical protein
MRYSSVSVSVSRSNQQIRSVSWARGCPKGGRFGRWGRRFGEEGFVDTWQLLSEVGLLRAGTAVLVLCGVERRTAALLYALLGGRGRSRRCVPTDLLALIPTGNPLRFNSLNRDELSVDMWFVAPPAGMQQAAHSGSGATRWTRNGKEHCCRQVSHSHSNRLGWDFS